jgi:hypothetical protein
MITAVLSSFNEANNAFFWSNLKLLCSTSEVETIVIDGGSTDGTVDRLRTTNGLQLEVLQCSNRAERYNRGLEIGAGSVVLLVHPRSLLPLEGLEFLARAHLKSEWGAFQHSFDANDFIFKFTSWYSNSIRGSRRGIFYLDHCIFLTSDLAKNLRFPSVRVFEDTLFCLEARKVGWPKLLPYKVVTSSVRFKKNGLMKQCLLNQLLKVLFIFGASDALMYDIYEKGLHLNQKK